MKPRITGGHAKGRVVASVPRSARPTSSRVREALFSLVGHELRGMTVLDAFAGSGLLGFEAWSRGATVELWEQNPQAIRAIKDNAAALGADVRLRRGDSCKLSGRFDIILCDPPYALKLGRFLEHLAGQAQRCLVLEADEKTLVPDRVGPLIRSRSRTYGSTALHSFEVAT